MHVKPREETKEERGKSEEILKLIYLCTVNHSIVNIHRRQLITPSPKQSSLAARRPTPGPSQHKHLPTHALNPLHSLWIPVGGSVVNMCYNYSTYMLPTKSFGVDPACIRGMRVRSRSWRVWLLFRDKMRCRKNEKLSTQKQIFLFFYVAKIKSGMYVFFI